MDAEILTDSSNYSEDFENVSEHEFSEQDTFPRLFDHLESSLANDVFLNYKSENIDLGLAVGLFLSGCASSKQDILDKISWEYRLKKENLYRQPRFQTNFIRFPKLLKTFLCESRAESEYLNLTSKRNIRKIIDDVRNKIMNSLGIVEKDKTQAKSMLESEMNSVCQKSEELQENFYWFRFFELLKSLIPSKIILSVPNEKQKNDVKQAVEGYFKQTLSIKNIISLEDSDFQLALANKKYFQAGPDRKTEISEIVENYAKAEEILAQFLTFSTKNIAKANSLNPFPETTLLNRACNF